MARLSKDALLKASDLRTKEIELETIGGSVVVQGLSAAYSNQASSEALEMKTTARGDQIASVNTAKLETIQVLHGLVEPKLDTIEEAEQFMQNCGPAAKAIVEATANFTDADLLAKVSRGLGARMTGIGMDELNTKFADRGW